MANLSDLFKFSEPRQQWTKAGPKWVRSAKIAPELLEGFFKFWNSNKISMKVREYSIFKNDKGEWTLNQWGRTLRDVSPQQWDDIDESTLNQSILRPEPIKDPSGLLPWQPAAVAQIVAALKMHNAAIDGSDTGTGKSFCAIAAARETGLKIGVICPKQVITFWERIITKHFKMEAQFVINYEGLRTGKHKEIGGWEWAKARGREKKIFKWNVPPDTLLIFDEAHKLKGKSTLTSKMAIYAKEQGYKILCCSATSAVYPMEMFAIGYILGLHQRKDFYPWIEKHGCERGRFGFHFTGPDKVLKKLHKDFFLDRGVRLRRDDIPNFPECDTQAMPYNIDEADRKQIEQIYFEMQNELRTLAKSTKNDKEKAACALTVSLRCRQRAEILKVPLFMDIINEHVADGLSCVVFLNFTETIEALSKRLDVKHIIWGKNKKTETLDERQIFIDDFQANNVKIILANVKAGGAGLSLHDIHGGHPRIAIISPSYSAVDVRQVLGRVHRVGSKSKALQRIVFIANTIEEDVCNKIAAKLKNLDLINDGDLRTTDENKN